MLSKVIFKLGKMLLALAVIILGIIYFQRSVNIERSKHWFPSNYRAIPGTNKIVKTIKFENNAEYYIEVYSEMFELLEIKDNIGFSDVKELCFEQFIDENVIESIKYTLDETK